MDDPTSNRAVLRPPLIGAHRWRTNQKEQTLLFLDHTKDTEFIGAPQTYLVPTTASLRRLPRPSAIISVCLSPASADHGRACLLALSLDPNESSLYERVIAKSRSYEAKI
jgi:hypothetical protein